MIQNIKAKTCFCFTFLNPILQRFVHFLNLDFPASGYKDISCSSFTIVAPTISMFVTRLSQEHIALRSSKEQFYRQGLSSLHIVISSELSQTFYEETSSQSFYISRES